MADITISDLELAPALTDDMVLPVENTTDTYAATLAMLRRLINKTFVEVENADFNALTDDGFYQCTGTPTNSPVAGAINWTLQVSAENGVVVQRAFSLDDNFANLYIRRWNGVTWTGWIEVGAGALNNKANINLSNLNNTGNEAASNLNSKGIRTVVETYKNGNYWYRIWSDGWIEQGGYADNNGEAYGEQAYTIYWLKPFSDDKYTFLQCQNSSDFTAGSFYMRWTQAANKTASSIQIWSSSLGGLGANTDAKMYYACGY